MGESDVRVMMDLLEEVSRKLEELERRIGQMEVDFARVKERVLLMYGIGGMVLGGVLGAVVMRIMGGD